MSFLSHLCWLLKKNKKKNMKILSKIKKRNVNRLLDTNLFFNYQDSKANPPSNKTSELQAKKKKKKVRTMNSTLDITD